MRLLGAAYGHLEAVLGTIAGRAGTTCDCGRVFFGDEENSSINAWVKHQDGIFLASLKAAGLDIVNGVICCSKCATMDGHRAGCVNE